MSSMASDGRGGALSCSPSPFTLVRRLVSKRKRRFQGDGFDLDLSLITPRLIASGYPSLGLEALYRNPASSMRRFLVSRHGAFRVWNLCAERRYDASRLGRAPEQALTWWDHTPPPFAAVRPLCAAISAWLAAAPGNVACIHCKAGKGRTGTLIAAALLHERSSTSAEEALRVFGVRRTHNGKGVTLPSQQRYVHYYALQLAAAERAATAAAAVADGSSGGSFRVGGAGAVDARLESAPQSPASPSPPPQAPPPVQARHLSRSVLKEEKEAALEPCAWHVELELRHRGGSGAWGFSLGQGIEGGALGRCTIATVTPGSGGAFKGGSSGSVMMQSSHRGDGEEGVEEWGPVCDFLHPGDEILSIGGTPVPMGAAGIRDAARMLLTRLARADKGAGGDVRLRLLLLRRAPFGGAAAAPPPLSPPKGSHEFWERVACAVGPWAGTLCSPSPAHAAPVPTIRLCSVALTHAPMVRGSVSVIGDFYWQLLSQAHCRSVVWDSRQGSGHVTPTGALAWLCNSNSSSSGGDVGGSTPLVGGDFRLVLRHTRERKPLISTWLHTAFLPIPHAARVALGHARGQGGWGGGICGSEAPSTAASDAASVEDVCVCEEDRAAAAVATMGDDVSAMAASADGCPTLGAMLTAAGCAPYAPANATGEASVAPLRGAATLRMRHLDGAVKADRKGNVWHACARLVLAYELILS